MAASPTVFIAYFGPDKQRAVGLHRALSARGLRPWCDAVDLLPGDLWDVVIPGKLIDARIIVVLVSKTEHDGWYAREEIAQAIDVARRDTTRRVVPVLLDGALSADAPYGLKRVSGIDVSGADYAPAVDGVARLWAALQGEPSSDDPPPRPAARPARVVDIRAIDHGAIIDAALRRRLDRDLLLAGLPDGMPERLPNKRNDLEQLTSDIDELVRVGRLADGRWAIALWLRRAERLAGPFAEGRVFRAALDQLGEA